MSFTSVAHIGLNRCKKIKGGLGNLDYQEYWMDILLYVTGVIFSVLMPFTTMVVYFYYGIRARIFFTLLKFAAITFTLLVSYVVIIRMVKNSKNRLKNLQSNTHSLHQQEQILGKTTIKTVNLVVEGYMWTLLPSTCSCAIKMYSFYNEDFKKDNEVFVYTFRSVSEMILYMNSIFNIIIYFQTNKELRKEVAQSILNRANIKLNSLKSLLSSKYNNLTTKTSEHLLSVLL